MGSRWLLLSMALVGCSDQGAAEKPSSTPATASSVVPVEKWERHAVAGASAKFPKKPESKPQTIKRPEGDVEVQMLVVEGDDGNVYALVVSNYKSELNLQAAFDTTKTSWSSVKDKTLTDPKPVELAGLPGREISFTAKRPLGGTQRTFVDAKNGLIYTIDVVSNDALDAAATRGFLDSLEIAPAK